MVSGSVDSGDGEAARWLSEEVERLGGRLTVRGSTLLELFVATDFNAVDSGRVSRAIAERGLRTVPVSLEGVSPDAEVVVENDEEPELEDDRSAEEETTVEPAADAAVSPSAKEVLAAQAAAVPAQAVAAGVLVPGVVAAAIGAGIWLPFALLFAAVGFGMWFALRQARFWFSRIFFWRFRSLWLSGFVLALVPMLIVTWLASAVVVAPIASKRAADKREDQALALIRRGNDQLDRGDVDQARSSLDEARDRDREVEGDDALESAITEEEQRREEEEANSAEYERGRKALEDDDPKTALAAFSGLGDYRDSEQLEIRARRELAARQLRWAQRLYDQGRYEEARRSAARSLRTRETQAARQLGARANTRISEQRAAARLRAQQRAAARKARVEAARREREAREAAEALAREQESQSAPDYSGGNGGCVSGSPIPNGRRDGDGDGCYGE